MIINEEKYIRYFAIVLIGCEMLSFGRKTKSNKVDLQIKAEPEIILSHFQIVVANPIFFSRKIMRRSNFAPFNN